MLAPKAQYSLADAKKYFKEHLSVGEYYSEGQQVPGQWFGKGAEDLGLAGVTQSEQFLRLCENLHPQTGEQLTLRQKTTRIEIGADGVEHEHANRRVFYDFTFSPPKSVSVAALAGHDQRIVEAHEQAVMIALEQLQSFAATRVRKQGQCADRSTGNIVAAVFRHDTSRALDPHLHSHCIVFNATHDAAEGCWKALQNHDMLVAQKFVENVYYHELARSMRGFGYEIENRPRGDFQIKGVSRELCDLFSKRHREIDQKTRELLEQQPEKAGANVAAIRENIAHKERDRKVRDMGLPRLQALWDGQMTAEQKAALEKLAIHPVARFSDAGAEARQAVSWAEEHLFERRSVVREHELWRHALEHARGRNLSLKDIQGETLRRDYLRYPEHPGQVTTREHLGREWEIVTAARDGISQFGPLCVNPPVSPQLDAEQQQAVGHILRSRDFATLFRGGAGTGKSFTLRDVQRILREVGYDVRVIAPQRQQVTGLQEDGLQNVETVSAFLARRDLPRGAVVLVDEAGQLGAKQMQALFRLIQASDGRVILSGDTRQHGAVEASDALWAIEKHSGVRPVELNTIRRQNPALARSIAERKWIAEYRQAVAEAQAGKFAESFDRLEKQGAITECTLANQHEKLAERYLALVKDRQSTVVVSQTWNEIHQVNEQIRLALKGAKLVGEAEKTITTHQPVDLTAAQKRDERSYGGNRVLVFNRDARGFKAGESARMRAITKTHLIVEGENRTAPIAFKHLDKVTVCECKELALSAGDRLQLKANGRSANNRKLANGELVTVKDVEVDGRIVLADGRVLSPQFRQFVRGYAVTSYASQGKSVNHVLFSDSASKAATNRQQWYVTISRGRKGVSIFTTDKRQLREQITHSCQRPLAMDLLAARLRHDGMFRRIERIWGRRVAVVMTLGKRRRQSEGIRQAKTQHLQQQHQGQSRGMGV